VFFPYWCPPLSLPLLSHCCSPPLLLLVFYYAQAFDKDLSSWDVSKVTDMSNSESSVRSLLLLLLVVVGRGVLSSVYIPLSPSPSLSSCGVLPLLVSPSLSSCGVLPLLVSPSLPLTLVSSPPPPSVR
jgi:surface protein